MTFKMTTQDVPGRIKIRQRFQTNPIEDIAGAVQAQFQCVSAADDIKPGQSVALTAGSRGINNSAEIMV